MDLLVSQALWWVPVLLLLGALQFTGKGTVSWGWVGLSIIVFAIYSAAVFWLPLAPGFPQVEGAQYNWSGKIAAIATTLAMMAVALKVSPAITRETLGLTLRQEKGSLVPAFVATAAMVALVVLLQQLGGDSDPPTTETLLYQAIIPGIDEELLFRGLLLALIATALAGLRRPWLWAGVAVTIVFAFGHSFFWSADGSQFDPVALAYVAILGALMMFIRLRTGSILLPIVAHNLTNVASQLA